MDIIIPRRLLTKDLLTSESFDCYEAFGHGVFQWRLMGLCTLAAFLMNINDLVFPLISRDVEHWCKQSAASNISEVAWRNAAVPAAIGGRLSQCLLYKHPEDADNAESVPCQEWEYDDERARTSIVSEWNLVCDRRLLIVAIVAVHNSGACVFTVAAGSIADHIGRKPVLLAGVTLLIVSTAAGCLSRTFLMLTTIGFFSSGSAGVVTSLAAVSFFEVTIHENRPLHIVVSVTAGLLFSDFYRVIFVPVKSPIVCYEDNLGCFRMGNLMTHSQGLPRAPTEVGTKLTLFWKDAEGATKSMDMNYAVPASDLEGLEPFSEKTKLVILAHGFDQSEDSQWIKQATTALLDKGCNVLVVDWSKMHSLNNAEQSARDTAMVARQLSVLVLKLLEVYPESIQPADIHAVGFSMGAHLVGFFGRHLKSRTNHKIGRITDPRKADTHGEKQSEQAVSQKKPAKPPLPRGAAGAFLETTDGQWDRRSWLHCLVVYLTALTVISAALVGYVVLSAPRQQAEEGIVHRRPTTVKILRGLTASNASGQPEADGTVRVAGMVTAAPTPKDQEYDREEDNLVEEEKNLHT
ncbi:hypothetical protein V5799_016560 [Amblyomma americanum]|uniref:Lipase domain-containing protein n=1 Tax=Amblyomma americanum TaxID=6943 RepID=A0AAQ4F610_AMBAM